MISLILLRKGERVSDSDTLFVTASSNGGKKMKNLIGNSSSFIVGGGGSSGTNGGNGGVGNGTIAGELTPFAEYSIVTWGVG